MSQFLWICFGGAIGTGARYLLGSWALRALGPGFPYGTLSVNVLGSFLVAVFMYLGVETTVLTPGVRLVLTTGLMGGFTTYSAFSYETLKYLQEGAFGLAAANALVTTFGCLAACALGWATTRWFVGL
jgi:CrcB protein